MLPLGVIHYSPSSQRIEHINNNSSPCRLNNNIVVSLAQDTKGRIWISTDHGGINVLNKITRTIEYILSHADDIKAWVRIASPSPIKTMGHYLGRRFQKRDQLLSREHHQISIDQTSACLELGLVEWCCRG